MPSNLLENFLHTCAGASCNHGWQTFAAQSYDAATTRDRGKTESSRERRAFSSVRRAESKYGRQLRSVASQIGVIVRGLTPASGIPNSATVEAALRRYAEVLRPWAKSVGAAMLTDVSRRDEAVWAQLGRDMTRALRDEIQRAPTGETFRMLLDEQVDLITSLPLRAAERVHRLATEARVSGERYGAMVDEIARSGHVTRSRATLIARTEVARTASGLVQARATYVGSEGYIWRTAEDSDVRLSHKKMSGRFVRWDSPPTTDNLVGHAGQLPNCRCYPEPVIPDAIH